MRDIVMPATDAGAITQWIALAIGLQPAVGLLYRVRQRDLAQLVLGLTALIAAWFGLRAVH